MAQIPRPASFTFRYPKQEKAIKTPVKISPKFDPSMEKIEMGTSVNMDVERPHQNEFLAIWDTGATDTCITRKAVDSVLLQKISTTRCRGVYGKEELRVVYIGCLYLPNQICIPDLRIIEVDSIRQADLLIGMDVIGTGDFALSVEDGKTVFSFRHPSKHCLDFVDEFNRARVVSPTSRR